MESDSVSGSAKPRVRRGRPPEPGLAERRRRQLVQSACVVFAERGFEAASISDVAKHAGVGQGTVYRYFDSKRVLLDHVLDHSVHRMLDAIHPDAAPTRPRSLAEFTLQFRTIAERLFALTENEPELFKLILVEASAIDDELKARLLGLENTVSALLASALRHGVRAGWLAADLDTEMVAHGINALVVPGLTLALRGEATGARRRRYVEVLVSLVINGIANQEVRR